MLNIKELIYASLNDCGLPLEDTPIFNRKTYPYGLLRLVGFTDTQYKNYTQRKWSFKVDIFSTYAGDQEILQWRSKITSKVFTDLMAQNEVTYVNNDLLILDDKEQGPVTKHGVISIEVITMEIEQEEEEG